jgi:hydroxymethylbilane synthase
VTEPVRVGTRRSALARAQTEEVLRLLADRFPERAFEPTPIVTEGDRRRAPTEPADFTDAIDRALQAGEVDLAVHSAKDLPSRPSRPVAIVAVPPRADPRDCLVLRGARSLSELPVGARIGSSSVRRRAQLRAARPDLEVVPIHGNVGTRLEKIETENLHGVMLAAAGLARLGWSGRISERLPLDQWLPAPGQGALAVAARRGDRAMAELAAVVDDRESRAAVRAEAAFSAALGGDCAVPLAALARHADGRLELRGEVLSDDGAERRTARATGSADEPERLGRRVAEEVGGDDRFRR